MAGTLKIVVVGGVAAGPKAAARARRLDPQAEITILEKGEFVSYAGCGLPYLIGGTVPDLKDLLATPVGVMRNPDFFRMVKDINVLTGKEATVIDRAQKVVKVRDLATSQEETYPYDRLVLATGAVPVRPPLPGIDLKNVFVIRHPGDGMAILASLEENKPRRAVLIGAGAIGLEVAEALVDRGLEVTVIEAMDQVFPGLLDFEMGAVLQRHLESHGVKVCTGERVSSFAGNQEGRLEKVYTDKGEYPAELAVLAIGVRPNVELARQAGLEIGPTGAIKVDRYLRTSDENIYAGGDCAEAYHRMLGRPVFVSSGQAANIQGRVIGTNITGGKVAYQGMVGTGVAKVFDFTVGCTGLTETMAKKEGLDVVTTLAPGLDHAHYYPDAKFVGLKMVAQRGSGRLLGVQVVGPGDAAKRLDVAAAAITMGATVTDLTQFNLGYAPPYSVAIDALIQAAWVVENKLTGVAQAVSPLELQELTAQGEDFMLLDVRTPAEFKEVRLKHPKVFAMPLGKLRVKAKEFPKDRTYIPFCKFSMRGYEAQKILEGLGFTRVKFLDGGVVQWPFELEEGEPGAN
jgi:NADPH-dependent 2,4-dienoyl-CoA reductase/sulfur reductase-like enzyme/rhodanese-related sulfurtransferase